mgnify:CR=1 FL=1
MDIQRIIFIGLPTSYDYIVTPLESEGHTVLNYDGMADCIFVASGDLSVQDKVATIIEEFEPTIIVNGSPKLVIPEGGYVVLQNTLASARFETCKWETRSKVEGYGFKLPTVINDCLNTDIIIPTDRTTYIKPKCNSTNRTTFKIPAGGVITDINTMPEYMVYVEESVPYVCESWAYFTVADGQYSINRTIGVTGFGNDKLVGHSGDWRDCTFVELTEDQDTKWREVCDALVADLSTKGGNFEGNIQGCIDSDLDCYFFEVNCRPETYNSHVLATTATNWLQGLINNPSLSDGHITAQQLQDNIQG